MLPRGAQSVEHSDGCGRYQYNVGQTDPVEIYHIILGLSVILTCAWFRCQSNPAAVTSEATGELAGSCGRPFVVSGLQATSYGDGVRWRGRVLECTHVARAS